MFLLRADQHGGNGRGAAWHGEFMARMLGTWSKPWCPVCKGPAGPDCPDVSRSKRSQRAREKRQWKTEAQDRTGQRA